MPNKAAMSCCRRVCVSSPLRASTARPRHRPWTHQWPCCGVLLVPRTVGNDVAAMLGTEIAVGNVNRDALLALASTVHQQCVVNVLALGAVPLAVALQ